MDLDDLFGGIGDLIDSTATTTTSPSSEQPSKDKKSNTKGRKKKTEINKEDESLDTSDIPLTSNDDDMIELQRALAQLGEPDLADLEGPTMEELEASLLDMQNDDFNLFMAAMPLPGAPSSGQEGGAGGDDLISDDEIGAFSKLTDSLFEDINAQVSLFILC